MNMYDDGQIHKISTVMMRGGTSKGLILRKADLPSDPHVRDEVILRMYGSPDPNQVDGLGGGTSLSSKLAIVGPPSYPGAHIDYTFGQVSLEKKCIDYHVMCGNFVTAVGLYAAEEGYVPLKEPITSVHIYNTNTDKMIVAEIPVQNGQIQYNGDFVIDGVPGSASRIMLHFLDAGGTFTGKTLPTGHPVDTVYLKNGRSFEVSIVDCANVVVIVKAQDLNLRGIELRHELENNSDALQLLEEIRVESGIMIGMIKEEDREKVTPSTHALPKIAFVSSPHDYRTMDNRLLKKEEMDIIARYISMGTLHRAYAVSGAMALSAASFIPGTIPNQLVSSEGSGIRIGHPSGVMYVETKVEKANGNWIVSRAANGRTARRLMEGYAYIPASIYSTSNCQ